jgi:beta-glucosidase
MPYSSCDYKQKFFIFDKLKIQENLNMMKRLLAMLLPVLLVFNCTETAKYEYPFQNPHLSFEERAADLLGRMTLEEKISQLNYESQAVDRLGVPAYNWWNECLHGVARAGIATVFSTSHRHGGNLG